MLKREGLRGSSWICTNRRRRERKERGKHTPGASTEKMIVVQLERKKAGNRGIIGEEKRRK